MHIQVSVVGYAKDAPDSGAWSPAMYRWLNTFAKWCRAEWGIPMLATPPKMGYGECYGYGSPCRFTQAQWRAYTGWSAHQNAPENTHWDAPVDWQQMLLGFGVPPQEDDDMFCKLGDKGATVEYWPVSYTHLTLPTTPYV